MEKEPCIMFCGVLNSSYGVMKIQSFKSSVSGAIPGNVQNISFLIFFAYSCHFMERESFAQFYGGFDHFPWTHEVAKF